MRFMAVVTGLFLILSIMGHSQANDRQMTSAHDFSFPAATGGTIDLAQYAGKAVLVVNTASQCGFTKQYGPLQALYEMYRDRGFVVIGVPSNDFGGQEPGTNDEIVNFTQAEFSVDFPIAAKSRVKGADAAPFYRWAGEQVGPIGKPRWNFHKYLIGPDGRLVTWFSTWTKPDSSKLATAIEQALPDPASRPDS